MFVHTLLGIGFGCTVLVSHRWGLKDNKTQSVEEPAQNGLSLKYFESVT